MVYVCELLTDEPEGGSAMIQLKIFLNLYEYLANLNCTGEPEALDLVRFAESVSNVTDDAKDEMIKEKELKIEAKVEIKSSGETVSDFSIFENENNEVNNLDFNLLVL